MTQLPATTENAWIATGGLQIYDYVVASIFAHKGGENETELRREGPRDLEQLQRQ